MAMVLKEQGQASAAQVLRVVTNNVGSPYWPRVTMGTPVEWMIEDTVGNARAALEGLMDLWPRVTMGTINENQSGEPVSHAAYSSWPRYTWGSACPMPEATIVESKEYRTEQLADFLEVWPRITWASTELAK